MNESYNIGSSWQKFWGFQETAFNFHCGSKDLFWIKKQHFVIHGSNHTMLVRFVSGKDKFAYVLRI